MFLIYKKKVKKSKENKIEYKENIKNKNTKKNLVYKWINKEF